jgi:hypothetical protein
MANDKISFADSGAILLVGSGFGIYVPQAFIESHESEIAWPDDSRIDETLLDLKSPDNELYWESWTYILDNCKLILDKKVYVLYQNEDLWAIPEEMNEKIDWENM